jgi:hypothetical protein
VGGVVWSIFLYQGLDRPLDHYDDVYDDDDSCDDDSYDDDVYDDISYDCEKETLKV